MICPFGGFPTIRHNELRDIIGNLLSEVCSNVAIEPSLQPLSGEVLLSRTTTTSQEARSDIRTTGFWTRMEDAFFDIRVSHANAPSNQSSTFEVACEHHECLKQLEYGMDRQCGSRFVFPSGFLNLRRNRTTAHALSTTPRRQDRSAQRIRTWWPSCEAGSLSHYWEAQSTCVFVDLDQAGIPRPSKIDSCLWLRVGGGGGEAVVRHCITNCVHLFCETLWSLTLLVIITIAKRMFFVRFCTCFFFVTITV